MSPDRLPSLLRQRALVTQHLAWLDAEISDARRDAPHDVPALDKEVVQATPPADDATANLALSPAAEEPVHVAAANARADEILERYAATDRFDAESTRRGCLLFAIATLVIGLVGLFVLYALRYR